MWLDHDIQFILRGNEFMCILLLQECDISIGWKLIKVSMHCQRKALGQQFAWNGKIKKIVSCAFMIHILPSPSSSQLS